jgi:glycosyltransferase involved in cell wall biosynthesis
MTVERSDASVVTEDGEVTRPPTLAVDATGLLLSTPGKAFVGISRIENFLVSAALADPDPSVEVVSFRLGEGRFGTLAPFEQRRLAAGGIAAMRVKRWPGAKAALAQAFEAVRGNPSARRNADRHLARTVTNGNQGFGFVATKSLIRAYRLYRRLLGWLGSRRHAGHQPAEDDRGIVLVCSHTLDQEDRSALSGDSCAIAFICHDLISVLRPDLVVQGRVEKAFGANVQKLVQSGATVLCTSDAVRTTLVDYARQTGISPPVVHRFPMPSLLYETASHWGMTSRIEAVEPFVLYCSTVEVRKNHIMLARIWQQALEEGVKLPKLVCAGRWGWMIDPLRAYLEAHPGLAEQVSFTGPIGDEELIRYYRSASFGVFPSHIEGWGFGASECLDFGIPVIVSTTPSLIEASGGLMPAIDSEDQQGWYAAIRKMAEDHAWRSSLVERIAQHHRPTPAAASWAAIKAGLQASVSRTSSA